MTESGSSRPEPIDRTKLRVWAAAAGRCTFCNRLVSENDDLGVSVPIGELAHNVGWGDGSPRGASELDAEQRRSAENLILLCRNCHKPADDGGVVGHFSVERLTQFKRDHEQRIRFLTDIGGDKTATIIRVVGAIRGSQPELTYDTVLGATTAAGYFPKMLPNAIRAEYEADLRAIADPGAPGYFAVCTRQIAVLMERVNDGIRHDEVQRLAVFGFARIPVLVYLGSRLDDMVPTLVFQRQRTDGECAWSWPAANEPAQFVIEVAKRGKDPSRVSLVVCLSGTVNLEELPSEHQAADTIYVLKPVPPASPGPSIVSSPDILTNFEVVLRQFMAALEAEHGQARHVSLFPAAPVSAAITLGRVLMPGVSPAWNVFDRRDDREFFEALEVRA